MAGKKGPFYIHTLCMYVAVGGSARPLPLALWHGLDAHPLGLSSPLPRDARLAEIFEAQGRGGARECRTQCTAVQLCVQLQQLLRAG